MDIEDLLEDLDRVLEAADRLRRTNQLVKYASRLKLENPKISRKFKRYRRERPLVMSS